MEKLLKSGLEAFLVLFLLPFLFVEGDYKNEYVYFSLRLSFRSSISTTFWGP